MARFKIYMPLTGMDAKVWLDDKDITSNLRSLELKAHAGDITTLNLEFIPEFCEIQGEGCIDVTPFGSHHYKWAFKPSRYQRLCAWIKQALHPQKLSSTN